MSMNDTSQISLTNSNSSTILVDKLVQKIALGCLLASLSVFTVCGNILVLYAIQTEKYLRTVSNLFILSLAVADLAVGLFVMPLNAANIITGRWPFSSAICKMWLSIDYVASTASIFNLVLLSLDRYWAVVHPLRYLQKRTRRRATIFILTVWFISLLWAPAVIFWSYIAPQHSDIIKDDECDTAFRLNKTFKTLTTLVNFYIPLLTMIIISCRIMVAIRSRSKMELGRRLSSATQKQMKHDRTHTTSISRFENETIMNENYADIQPASPTIVINPFDSSDHSVNNLVTIIEPGQCFCSTCQTFGGSLDDSIWQLQQTSRKDTVSSLRECLSYAQIKPVSLMLTKTPRPKEDKRHQSQDIHREPFDRDNRIKSSVSLSDNMNHAAPTKVNDRSQKKLVSIQKKKSMRRTFSITSSSSSDEAEETTPTGSTEKPPKKSVTLQNTTSKPSSPVESRLRVPMAGGKQSIVTINSHSSANSTAPRSPKTNFFSTLINPSRSSSLQKELKAARQLGMLVGVFTITWLPYFILFFVVAWCNHCVSGTVYTASIWLGYLNSTVNPLIYPLCNAHFRRAFKKICYCKHAKTKLPNLNALRELHALRSRNRRR